MKNKFLTTSLIKWGYKDFPIYLIKIDEDKRMIITIEIINHRKFTESIYFCSFLDIIRDFRILTNFFLASPSRPINISIFIKGDSLWKCESRIIHENIIRKKLEGVRETQFRELLRYV